jgi:hypothetical protein
MANGSPENGTSPQTAAHRPCKMERYALPVHQHGKSKVRVARVWREGSVHHAVEWNVNTMVESPM